MRLIDADKLIEHITNTADLGGWIGEALQQIKQVAIKYINLAPTIKTKQVKYYDEVENVWKIGEVVIDSSEKPNNCEYAENPSGDVWECGCFLDTYCEHQIYDRNPDGTINIVECGYEPKDEPQTERSSE